MLVISYKLTERTVTTDMSIEIAEAFTDGA